MRPTRVLRIIARLNVGGPARHVLWLTAGLPQPRFQTTLVVGMVPPGEDDMSSAADKFDIEPVVIPEMSREISWKDAVTLWKIYRLMVRLRPDIVHTHTAKAGTVGRVAGLLYRWLTPGALLGRPRKCRFVHTYHGHVFHSYYGPLKTRFFLWIDRSLARLATDKIIVISKQQYEEIHGRFRVGRAAQFIEIPLGIDFGAFSQPDSRRAAARKQLGAGTDDILVGIVGRLTEIKNHLLFLQAARVFRDQFNQHATKRVRFLIIGNGQLRQTLETQSRGLGLSDTVRFLGLRTDPENFYPALDVVALTSRNEGTPLTLIEAMANERPVIATLVGGVVDLLGHPEVASDLAANGYALCERGIGVEPDNAQSFARGLDQLIADAALRDRLGKRGRRFVEQRCSHGRLLTDIGALYDHLTISPLSPAVPEHEDGSLAVAKNPL